MQHQTEFKNIWTFEAFSPDGRLKWSETVANDIVDTGLDDILDKYWKGSSYVASHFVGLTDGTPTVAGADTMASHGGWTEVTAYDESSRQVLTLGTVSGQAVDNSAAKAAFTVSADSTVIGGAFLATDNTKGGTSGTLVAVAGFAGGDKALDDDDILNVTVTLTAATG